MFPNICFQYYSIYWIKTDVAQNEMCNNMESNFISGITYSWHGINLVG